MNGKEMNGAVVLLLLAGVTQAAGCAFGTRYVELGYPPQKPAKIDAMESATALGGPRTREVILVVNDARPSRDRIGNVRNGYGMDTASILTETNVEVWVYDAIELELVSAIGRSQGVCYEAIVSIANDTIHRVEQLDSHIGQRWFTPVL